MGALLEFLLLFVCWLAALATLLVFLETWFGLSGRNRLIARRASGAYGLISVFVPMYGRREKVQQTVRSVLGQSYPFIELVLIHCEETGNFESWPPSSAPPAHIFRFVWPRRRFPSILITIESALSRPRSRPLTAAGLYSWIRIFCSTGSQLKLRLNSRDPTKSARSLFIPEFGAPHGSNKSSRPRWSSCFR